MDRLFIGDTDSEIPQTKFDISVLNLLLNTDQHIHQYLIYFELTSEVT